MQRLGSAIVRDARAFVGFVLVLAAAGCGGGVAGADSPETVTITNKIATLPAGQSYMFLIDVAHDHGAGFSVTLDGEGTLTRNGMAAIYIAPPRIPALNSITVNAFAANDPTIGDSVTFSITAAAGPVVSISPASFTASGGGAPIQLDLTVTPDDPSDVLVVGVTGSPDCGGVCGSFGTVQGKAGGGAYTVQYFPPADVTETTIQQINALTNLPNGTPGVSIVTLDAGSAPPRGCPTQGNESVLALSSQQWMFLLSGTNAGNGMAMGGIFAPDGAGGIQWGTLDVNVVGSAPATNLVIDPATSSYSVDATGRGCLQISTVLGRKTFRFALQGRTAPTFFGGTIIEFDDTTGVGERAIGTLEPAIPGGGGNAAFAGGAFGLQGRDASSGPVAVAGNLTTDGKGNVVGGLCDTNDAGVVTSAVAIPAGTYAIDAFGRGTFSVMNGTTPLNGVIYLGKYTGDFLMLSTDPVSGNVPLLSGRGTTSAALPTGADYLIQDGGKLNATIEIAHLDAGGSLTGNLWQDYGGTSGTSAVAGTFAVADATWNRVTMSGTGTDHAAVAYTAANFGPSAPIRGFTLASGTDAQAGTIVAHTTPPPNFGVGDLAFPVAFGYSQHTASGPTFSAGTATFDGAGGYTGVLDASGPNGLNADFPIGGNYAVNPDGSGTVGGAPMVIQYAGAGGTSCFFWFIDESAATIHASVSSGAR
jgi:hypothetical protein